ncbi:unnamed protein product [Choristocarpus tenellus]
MAEPASELRTKILLRKQRKLELCDVPPSKGEGCANDLVADTDFPELEAAVTEWSRDGRYLAAVCSNGVEIVDTESNTVVSSIAAAGVRGLHFSPLGTFFLTWQAYVKPADGSKAPGNLVVWRTDSWVEELRSVSRIPIRFEREGKVGIISSRLVEVGSYCVLKLLWSFVL